MKYWYLETILPIAGAGSEYTFKAESLEEAQDIAHDKTVEEYESYGIEEESNGMETEYDYDLHEITLEEHKEYIKDGMQKL